MSYALKVPSLTWIIGVTNFSLLSLLDKEFLPGNYLCDSFPDCVSFYSRPQDVKVQIHKLNDVVITSSSDSSSCIILLDASIKNYVTTSISYIYLFNQLIVKACHQAINVSTTKAELFTIRYGINQAVGIPNIK